MRAAQRAQVGGEPALDRDEVVVQVGVVPGRHPQLDGGGVQQLGVPPALTRSPAMPEPVHKGGLAGIGVTR